MHTLWSNSNFISHKVFSFLKSRINTTLHIPDKLFCIFDSLVIETFAEINTIPILVLACRFCPKNIEGTVYALIMSSLNFGNMVSFQMGGILMHFLGINENSFDNLWILIIISNLSMLTILPMLHTVDFKAGAETADEGEEVHN